MYGRLFFIISILWFFLTGCSRKEQRVLIFSSTSGDAELRTSAMTSLREHLEKIKIKADTTTHPAFLTQDSLIKFGALVLLDLPGDALTTRHQTEVERFIEAGGGMVAIHCSPSSQYQWPWFNRHLGYSGTQADSGSVRKLLLTAANKSHEAMDGIPDTWNLDDNPSPHPSEKGTLAKLVTSEEGDVVSWYRQTEMGNLFATTLGGRPEAYADETFLNHVTGGIRYALEGGAPDYAKTTTSPVPEENRFLELVLDTYLDEPIEMEILDEGKVLFIERHGRVKLFNPVDNRSRVIGTLAVQLEGNYEDGLLGLEIDPEFDRNGFVYLYYSPLGGEPVQRLSRFKMEGDSLLMNSEKIVLTVPVQRETCCHSAGNVYFGPDGLLYLSTGDNTSSKESDGFTPIDERPGRGPFDAQKSSGNTHDLRGKILRIKLNDDGSYSIPDGNLFPKNGSAGRPEIYVMGARNPYRITVDRRGFVYWGDVGPDGGESTERGPQSYDEWNQARKPGYFGWPYFVANNKAYADFDFSTNTIGPRFDPENVLNESPNNTGSKKLPPAQPAMIFYPYGKSAEFPMLGTGSRSAMAGPFYYFDKYPGGVKLPEYYDNKMFIYEWARNWIKVLTFTDDGDLTKIEPFLPGISFWHPIDLKFGPDGAMYVLQYGSNYFARNPDAQLVRLEYAEGNRQPVAKITPDKVVGAVPLTVTLSARNSFDYDPESSLSFLWESGNGQTSTEAEPAFVYEKEGAYPVRLTVTDEQGSKSVTSVEVKAGNEPPVVNINMDENTSFYFDNTSLHYSVEVEDREDGTLDSGIDPSNVRFTIDFLREGKDLALLNSMSTTAISARHLKGKSLIDGSDCKSCHALNKKSVGPSYIDVAQRYKGKSGADAALIQKIIKGGGGNWGHAIMAAHPQLSEGDTRQMVEYILSLTDEKTSLPMRGTYALNDHKGKGEAGSYVVSASYTDSGHPVTGPLTGKQMFILRHPRVQAEDFDTFLKVGQQRPVGSDQVYVSDIRDGSHIMFRDIDLTGIGRIKVNANANNGRIEIRTGSPEGELIGSIDLSGNAASWPFPWRELGTPIKESRKREDLYFVFKNDQDKTRQFMGLDWILFENK